jgi:hypothetical protein
MRSHLSSFLDIDFQANSSQAQIADSSSTNAVKLFIRTHNETLSVIAVGVCNEDRSPVGNQSLRRSPTPTSFAEIVGDDSQYFTRT